MKYRRISEAELDEILDTQFNPPKVSKELSEKSFYFEWKGVQSIIKQALDKLCFKLGANDVKYYTMSDDWGLSRHHEIEIHDSQLFDQAIISTLQGVLRSCTLEYEIVFTHDLFLRRDVPPFHLIIRKHELLARGSDEQFLDKLIGFVRG